MAELISASPKITERIGRDLGKTLRKGDVVAIFGGMGSGKTVFVRGLAVGMGIKEFISSPTFALVHEYKGNPPLFHFDMYRINSWDDLFTTGFFDYLNLDGVLAIEWSENIETALPDYSIRVEIKPSDIKDERRIIIVRGEKESESSSG